MPEAEAIVVLMTAASSEEAARIAEVLVTQRLAACVQILPEMQSIYFWKNKVQHDREVLMIAKTVRANFAALEQQVRSLHSYETPEIVALPIAAGSEGYLEW